MTNLTVKGLKQPSLLFEMSSTLEDVELVQIQIILIPGFFCIIRNLDAVAVCGFRTKRLLLLAERNDIAGNFIIMK